MNSDATYDYIIIGSGIIGMAIARSLRAKYPNDRILVIDKEAREAYHASSRNSGVLHAGFYYTSNTLKAKLTVAGNRSMRDFCNQHGIDVNQCGKLVVAKNADEIQQLYELERRGQANGSNVAIISEAQANELEPNVRTYQKALHSPDTASVNPKDVCKVLRDQLLEDNVTFSYKTRYLKKVDSTSIQTSHGIFQATKRLINCAGVYADRVAQDFGFGQNYQMLPFKGIYLKYTKNVTDLGMNIYPVPDLKMPFLGIHFTKTASGEIKIGPTAMPAMYREHYDDGRAFNWEEFKEIIKCETGLFLKNSFGFRDLAIQELSKLNKGALIKAASRLVKSIDPDGFTEYTPPGIRAQLLNKQTSRLVDDFVIEGDQNTLHILNAVSPAFTCAFPFANLVVENYLKS